MSDPYSPEPDDGYTKPQRHPAKDSEGGTRVVGPRSHAGGIQIQGGVPVVPVDFDPKRPGVQHSPVPRDVMHRPGPQPVRLNYDPRDKRNAGVRPQRIQGHPHMAGSGGAQVKPWYVVKQEIQRSGIPDERAYNKMCAIAYAHAQQGSFIPEDLARILYGQWQYGSKTAGGFLTWCQRLQRKHGAR